MFTQDSAFFQELLSVFKNESRDHIAAIHRDLPALQKNLSEEQRREMGENLFRAAHSIKGAARTVGLTDIETLGQAIEHAFARIKALKEPLDSKSAAVLLKAAEVLGQTIDTMDDQGQVTVKKSLITGWMDRLDDCVASGNNA
jgi:two-component system chemotaxis sensor kinase CheA